MALSFNALAIRAHDVGLLLKRQPSPSHGFALHFSAHLSEVPLLFGSLAQVLREIEACEGHDHVPYGAQA